MFTLTRSFLLLFNLIIFSLFSSETHSPEIIDYGKFKASIHSFHKFEKKSWEIGFSVFNYAPELFPFFAKLKHDHQIDVAVETGTFLGGTAVAFSFLFDKVHTIELNETIFKNSLENLKDFSNVQCHLGNSEQVLKQILPYLQNQRVLFYLDAHWGNHWPLLNELKEISRTHNDNCIIVIDDFKVPNRPDIPFDAYGSHECSYEYIKAHLDKIFSQYNYYILIPKSRLSRAKFVAIPKTWRSLSDDIDIENEEIEDF